MSFRKVVIMIQNIVDLRKDKRKGGLEKYYGFREGLLRVLSFKRKRGIEAQSFLDVVRGDQRD